MSSRMKQVKMLSQEELDQLSSTIRLPDGRKLGYLETGDPLGRPVFYFHGWPGSRVEALLYGEAARQAKVRLIGVDRPGMGLSDFQPGRKLLDWPEDIQALADALGIPRFSVVGSSAGTPFVLACAYRLPKRVVAAGLVAGVGPSTLGENGVEDQKRRAPLRLRKTSYVIPYLMNRIIKHYRKHPEKVKPALDWFISKFPAPDNVIFSDPETGPLLVLEAFEAFRQGPKGLAYDILVQDGPWGFRLRDILFDRFHLWHGEKDHSVPIYIARRVVAALRKVQAIFYPNDGHLSLMFNHASEILTTVTA